MPDVTGSPGWRVTNGPTNAFFPFSPRTCVKWALDNKSINLTSIFHGDSLLKTSTYAYLMVN